MTLSIQAPEVPFLGCAKLHFTFCLKTFDIIFCTLKTALPVSKRKKGKNIEMCPKNLHSTPQNQDLATQK